MPYQVLPGLVVISVAFSLMGVGFGAVNKWQARNNMQEQYFLLVIELSVLVCDSSTLLSLTLWGGKVNYVNQTGKIYRFTALLTHTLIRNPSTAAARAGTPLVEATTRPRAQELLLSLAPSLRVSPPRKAEDLIGKILVQSGQFRASSHIYTLSFLARSLPSSLAVGSFTAAGAYALAPGQFRAQWPVSPH
ncbi:hypothetical protein GQ600_18604 [Phytophthora cactorum]|nr:hypothetical protein GQ600_18604 [Phytophthora cactorum]